MELQDLSFLLVAAGGLGLFVLFKWANAERILYKKALASIRKTLLVFVDPEYRCQSIRVILDHEGIKTADEEALEERIKDPTLG